MAEPVYDKAGSKIPSEANPCYDVASFKPLGTAASSCTPEAKRPSHDWFHWCVLTVLVLVGVMACVSMAVAVWSIAKVNSIDEDYTSKQMQVIISLDNISRDVEALRCEVTVLIEESALEAHVNVTTFVNNVRN
jgi:hypothetical protein